MDGVTILILCIAALLCAAVAQALRIIICEIVEDIVIWRKRKKHRRYK